MMNIHHTRQLSPAGKRFVHRGAISYLVLGALWFGLGTYLSTQREPASALCDPGSPNSTYEEIVLGADTIADRRVWYIDRCGDGTVDQYVVRKARFTTSILRHGSAEVVKIPSTRMTPDEEIRLDDQYLRLRNTYLAAMNAR